jgi:hypothetical protein
MDTFVINTWTKLPEIYQRRVTINTLPTVKRQIQYVENRRPAAVISMEVAGVDNTILLDYLTSKVALEEPQIGSLDPNVSIDNNCTYEELHFGMQGSSEDYDNEGYKNTERSSIPTASQQ